MYNLINFWYGIWEKVCMKRSWRKKGAKTGGPALYTDKNFFRNWLLVCKLGYSRNVMKVEDVLFWKSRWNFKVCYFILENSGQSKASSLRIMEDYIIPLANETKFFVVFSLLPLKISVIFCLTPGNSTFYFFNTPGKSKSWKCQFRNFNWTDLNYWSWDTRETNLEYLLFGISISLLAICS